MLSRIIGGLVVLATACAGVSAVTHGNSALLEDDTPTAEISTDGSVVVGLEVAASNRGQQIAWLNRANKSLEAKGPKSREHTITTASEATTSSTAANQTSTNSGTTSSTSSTSLPPTSSTIAASTTTTLATTTSSASADSGTTVAPGTSNTTTAPTTTTTTRPTTASAGGRTISAGEDLAGIINSAPAGSSFWIEPGAVFTGTLTPADHVTILSDPANPFIMDGQNSLDLAVTGSAVNVELGGVEIRNYGTNVPESYTEMRGENGAKRAVDLKNMPGFNLHDFYIHHVDAGIQVPPAGLIENGLVEYAKFMSIKCQNVSGFTVRDFTHRYANVKANGGFYYDDSYGASVKFVGCTDYLIEDWTGTDNHGPSFWADSGNSDAVARNVVAMRNTAAGIIWEINSGPFLLDGFHAEHNHGAANVVISNSRGTAADPIIIRNGKSIHHDRDNGWAIGLLATGRGPGLAHVRIENVSVDAPIKLRNQEGLPQSTLDTIVAIGCVDTGGNPVGIAD